MILQLVALLACFAASSLVQGRLKPRWHGRRLPAVMLGGYCMLSTLQATLQHAPCRPHRLPVPCPAFRAVGSWGPAIVGHANDEVNAALKAQIDKGTSFGAPCELEVRAFCWGGGGRAAPPGDDYPTTHGAAASIALSAQQDTWTFGGRCVPHGAMLPGGQPCRLGALHPFGRAPQHWHCLLFDHSCPAPSLPPRRTCWPRW